MKRIIAFLSFAFAIFLAGSVSHAVVHDDAESTFVELSVLFKGTSSAAKINVTVQGQPVFNAASNGYKTYTETTGDILGNGTDWIAQPVRLMMYKGVPLDYPLFIKVDGAGIAEYKITVNPQDEKYVTFISGREMTYNRNDATFAADPNARPAIKRRFIYWNSSASTTDEYPPEPIPHIYGLAIKRAGIASDAPAKLNGVMPGWMNGKISLGQGKTGKDLGYIVLIQGRELRIINESDEVGIVDYPFMGTLNYSQVITPSTVYEVYYDANYSDTEVAPGAFIVNAFDRADLDKNFSSLQTTTAQGARYYSLNSGAPTASTPTVMVKYTISYKDTPSSDTSLAKTKIIRQDGETTLVGYAYQLWVGYQMILYSIQTDIGLVQGPVRHPSAEFRVYSYDFVTNGFSGDRICKGLNIHASYADTFNWIPDGTQPRINLTRVGKAPLSPLDMTPGTVASTRLEYQNQPFGIGAGYPTDQQEWFFPSMTYRVDGADTSDITQGLTGSATYYLPSSGTDPQTGAGSDFKMKQQSSPDGSWSYFTYYDDLPCRGLLKTISRPSSLGPATPASAPLGAIVTDYIYTENWDRGQTLPMQAITRQIGATTAQNQVLSATTYDYSESKLLDVPANQSTFQGYKTVIETSRQWVGITGVGGTDETINERTVRFRDDAGYMLDQVFSGLPISATHTDGTKEAWYYEMGSYDETARAFNAISDQLFDRHERIKNNLYVTINNQQPIPAKQYYDSQEIRVWHVNGLAQNDVTLSPPCTQMIIGSASAPQESVFLVPGKTTAEMITRDKYGRVRLVETYAWVVTDTSNNTLGWKAVDRESHDYGKGGNLIASFKQRNDLQWEPVYKAIYTTRNSPGAYNNRVDQMNYSQVTFDDPEVENSTILRTGRKEYEWDRSGLIKRFKYDEYGRVSKVITLAPPSMSGITAPPELQTRYTYDAEGRVLTTAVGPRTPDDTDAQYAITTTRTYTQAGMLASETAPGPPASGTTPGGYTTYFDYSRPAGEGMQTIKGFINTPINVSDPQTFKEITRTYIDSSQRSIAGVGVVPHFFSYPIVGSGWTFDFGPNDTESIGIRERIESVGADGLVIQGQQTPQHTTRKQIEQFDWLGRKFRTTQTNPGAGNDLSTDFTFSGARLMKTKVGSLADALNEYEPMGQLKRHGAKLESTLSTLKTDSVDRISDQDTSIYLDTDGLYERSQLSIYGADNSSQKTLAKEIKRPLFLKRQSITLPGYGSVSVLVDSVITSKDISGRIETKTVFIARDLSLVIVQTGSSDQSQVDLQILRNGLPAFNFSATQVRSDFTYDSFGRPRQTISRTGSTDTIYTDGATQVAWAKSTDNIWTRFEYDSFGRTKAQKQYVAKAALAPNLNDQNVASFFRYNKRDQLINVWGHVPYPIKYLYYDSGSGVGQYSPEFEGMLFEEQTFNDKTGAATWTTADIWPGENNTVAPGIANRKQYTYYAENGRLNQVKTDTTGAGTSYQTTSYSYDNYGHVTQRTWNRKVNNVNVKTVYAYDLKTGELISVTYDDDDASDSEAPPNVTDIKYTRLGALKSLKDAADPINGRTFNYRAADPTRDFRLESESLPSATYGSALTLSYTYDTFGRNTGWNIKRGGSAADNFSTLAYDSGNSRISTIQTPAGAFVYSYLLNGAQVVSVSSLNLPFRFRQERTVASDSDLVTAWNVSAANKTIASYSMLYDSRNRLQKYNETGQIYENYGTGLSLNLGYNDRNELTSYATYLTTNLDSIPNPAFVLPRRTFGFTYDAVGNRKTTQIDTDATLSYVSNLLGEYDSRGRPNFVEISGLSGKNASVSATRSGVSFPITITALTDPQYNYFYGKSTRLNSPLTSETMSVTASLPGGTPSTSTTRNLLAAAVDGVGVSNEIFSYGSDDTADGNLLSDAFWTYKYDAENRLRQVQSKPGLPSVRISFVHDFLGRRVKKTIETLNGATWVATGVEVYAYIGWQLTASYNVSGALQKSYFWGIDLSGSTAGAGGIGGLLGLKSLGAVFLTINDDFGNVVGLVDGNSGTLQGAYEYSPFGEQLRASGPSAGVNPFRFSSKMFDSETGLSWFGYRYYSSTMGRFITRDPIDEPGRSVLGTVLTSRRIDHWSYVGSIIARSGESRKLTPDTSINTAGLSHSTTSESSSDKNSTLPGTIISGQKSRNGWKRGDGAGVPSPGSGQRIDGAGHAYRYSRNSAYSRLDVLGLWDDTIVRLLNKPADWWDGSAQERAATMARISMFNMDVARLAYNETGVGATIGSIVHQFGGPPARDFDGFLLTSREKMAAAFNAALLISPINLESVVTRGFSAAISLSTKIDSFASDAARLIMSSESRAPSLFESFFESATRAGAGDSYALYLLSGGTGRAFTGHGSWDGISYTVVPEGTYLNTYTRLGGEIPSPMGRAIEKGDYDTVFGVYSEESVGATSFGPGMLAPDLTLHPPDRLFIYGESMTVGSPTPLSRLLKPNMGQVDWSACLVCP